MIDDFIEVGTVQEIWRYPVKSMAGERLDAARVSWYGLDGDRRAAFVRDDNHSGFPWLTARQAPELVRYQPFYANPTQPDEAALQVKTPDGRILPLDSAELREELAELYGRSVSPMRIKRGIFDTLTLSLMSRATAQALDAVTDFPLDYRRFRQNIIIETFDGRPFAEEDWLGQVLIIGEARIRLNRPISRCQMINVDPDTAVRNTAVLQMVAQTRNNHVGIGCTPETPGLIRVGDTIKLAN